MSPLRWSRWSAAGTAAAIVPSTGFGAFFARVRALFLALFLALVLAPRTAQADPFDATHPAWDSLSVFVGLARTELGPQRVVVTQELDYASLAPEDAVVLVHPVGDLDLASLSRFLHEGGRVVLLDDFGDGDLLLSHFGMMRRPLGEPSQTLGNRLYLPIAKPSSYHPTVVDVDQVVLNHASCIDHPDLSSVLEVETRSGEKKAVAVAGAVGKGRLLAVADSSVFVDGMLRFAGNETFARAVVRYAVEDDVWGKRQGRLLILSDSLKQVGVFGEASAASAFFEEATRGIREALQKLREEGLSGIPAIALAVLAALGCVLWVAKRAAKPHTPQLPRFLIPVSVLGRGGQPGHVSTLLAKTTPRALALLEHKVAFEEKLAAWLGLPEVPKLSGGTHSPLPPQPELLELLRARGASATHLAELRQLLFRLSQAETWLLSRGRAPTVTEGEVVRISERLEALLAAFTGSSGAPSSSSQRSPRRSHAPPP